jgi:cell division cycle 14
MVRPGIDGLVYIHQQNDKLELEGDYRLFHSPKGTYYHGLCDDFGPVNMSSIIHFIKQLQEQFELHPTSKIVFCIEKGRRPLTNAVFLIGAFMILKLDMPVITVAEKFQWVNSSCTEAYRDATYLQADFHLHLLDCWRGLEKGKSNGWVRYSSSGYMWGDIDVDLYDHYDNPVNGHMHIVIPQKFIAFQGPEDLGGQEYKDDHRGGRVLSPAFCAQALLEMGASTVIRLNEVRYDASEFERLGLEHIDLPFPDCTPPPPAVVAAFLRAADAATGLVAVHCHAGLGRTGTLIGVWLMRTHGFTAREAMGWLRIMRPGSVIGDQQRFLCHVGAALAASPRPLAPSAAAPPAAVPAVSEWAAAAAAAVNNEATLRRQRAAAAAAAAAADENQDDDAWETEPPPSSESSPIAPPRGARAGARPEIRLSRSQSPCRREASGPGPGS